ncbi:MAG: recombinase RecD, partial [Candidatus Raymondbacteria bacterium RifOxyB12_full_50_8]
RITFTNPENGYTIAKAAIPGSTGRSTVVGILPDIAEGEMLELSGEWSTHPKFGRQFKLAGFKTIAPDSVFAIEKYLGSGLIKGIGPHFARKLVERFGVETLNVIDSDPDKLGEVPGIGEKRADMIKAAWQTQMGIRKVMMFLQEYGVGLATAARIYRRYGQATITLLKENPFRLADEVHGIGFKTADAIARTMGIAHDSPLRAEAGLLYTLESMTNEGHCFYPYVELLDKCVDMLGIERDGALKGFARIFEQRKVVVEDLNTADADFKPDNKAVYPAWLHAAESGVARRIKALASGKSLFSTTNADHAIAWVQQATGISLAPKQAEGVRAALKKKVLVITGGPGTGKTTMIKAVLAIFKKTTDKIVMAAPTGRAAKRLAESTGHAVKTIHRLLEWDFKEQGFKCTMANQLDAHACIVDEVSMVDTSLMYHLLLAIPDHAVLVLVGDAHQLPSVGAGTVLADIMRSGAVPVVELTEIFRQAMGSRIVTNAHRINSGDMPELSQPGADTPQDFFFFENSDPMDVRAAIIDLVTKRIPDKFNLDPLKDIMVLSPMHKGEIGTAMLNAALQEALNPHGRELARGGRCFREGDKIMQVQNNYDKDVFNGDLGFIRTIDPEEQTVEVLFDGRAVSYDFTELDDLMLAYAISIHKSQGSEYPAVIIPVHTTHFIMLQRTLLYTAVTRAKKLAVLVGTKKALSIAVKNDATRRRFTLLAQRLQARE